MTGGRPTIAALLTPLAPGAIAVVGLTGPQADTITLDILRHRHADGPVRLADRRPTLCRLFDGQEDVDDVVAVRIANGSRVIIEINAHGGVRIAQRTLTLLAAKGATIVDGLAFLEAVSPGDPIEHDADRALLSAASRRLTRWLLAQRSMLPGYLSGLTSTSPDELAAFRLRTQVAVRCLAGMRVAIIGPPNAGKSTLANRLIGVDRVITSEQPGTTRDWVSETALIRGWPVTLIDTAGIRNTTCPVESEAIRRGSDQAGQADVVIVVLDGSAEEDGLRRGLEESLASISCDLPRAVVLNKCDLPSRFLPEPGGRTADLQFCNPPPLRISALAGLGVDALEELIESLLGLNLLDDSLPTGFLPQHLSNPD